MGKYGRVPALPFKLYNRNEKDIMAFIDETVSYLLNLDNVLNTQTDTDLLNRQADFYDKRDMEEARKIVEKKTLSQDRGNKWNKDT